MTSKPVFFEQIREKAESVWEKFSDPDVYGPIKTLFRQIQSTRFVISELLQNADDAGASAVNINLVENRFSFAHNGRDFTAREFESICHFANSSKKTLQTIGSRGIGFKSIFSVGSTVNIQTPTLEVEFHEKEFIIPIWQEKTHLPQSMPIYFGVEIKEPFKYEEMQTSISFWKENPESLLFFRNIRQIIINNESIEFNRQPIEQLEGAFAMFFIGASEKKYIRIQSDALTLPGEFSKELREENNGIELEKDLTLTIDLLLKGPSALFVVLPTEIRTRLPFTVNAPFIQDPDRKQIKWPSQYNQWLLEESGKMAAKAILQWVSNKNTSLAERAKAYDILPQMVTFATSLDEKLTNVVANATDLLLKQHQFVLTPSGALVRSKVATGLPDFLFDVWSISDLKSGLLEKNQEIVAPDVSPAQQEKLYSRGYIEQLTSKKLYPLLRNIQMPVPKDWMNLIRLWKALTIAIESDLYWDKKTETIQSINIVPVSGSNVLYPANECIRLGEKNYVVHEEDWSFLAKYLLVINQNYVKKMARLKLEAERSGNKQLAEHVKTAYDFLEDLKLAKETDTHKAVNSAIHRFLSASAVLLSDRVRMAQIAAKLNIRLERTNEHIFVNSDGHSIKTAICDIENDLEELISDSDEISLKIDSQFTDEFNACTLGEWQNWMRSGGARLVPIPLPQPNEIFKSNSKAIEIYLNKKGYDISLSEPYKSNKFFLIDYDYSDEYWAFWDNRFEEDKHFYFFLLSRIFTYGITNWQEHFFAHCYQEAKNGHQCPTTNEKITSAWIQKMAERCCLIDTRGTVLKPNELFIRNEKTEAFRGDIQFLSQNIDTSENKNFLLLLGVNEIPPGPEFFLQRLQNFVNSDSPPQKEIYDLYRKLDSSLKMNADKIEIIKDAFRDRPLIYTNENSWEICSNVFLNADADEWPGTAIIPEELKQLSLWYTLGVRDRPVLEHAQDWLQSLHVNEFLSQKNRDRLEKLLARHPDRMLKLTGLWLAADNTLQKIDKLEYGLYNAEQKTLVDQLYDHYKARIADFSVVENDQPELQLPNIMNLLTDVIDNDFAKLDPQPLPWLNHFANMASRISDLSPENARIAKKMTIIHLALIDELQVTPTIANQPAGPTQTREIAFVGDLLVVRSQSEAKLAKVITEYVAGLFKGFDIREAIYYCYDRPLPKISEYMKENYALSEVFAAEHRETQEISTQDVAPISDKPRPLDIAAEALPGHLRNQNEPIEPELYVQQPPSSDEESEGHDEPRIVERKPSAPKIDLFTKYVMQAGFQKINDGLFANEQGLKYKRENGLFQWALLSISGSIKRRIWVKDACLEENPVEMPHEIWSLIVKRSDNYAILLRDLNGAPRLIEGTNLLKMRDQNEIDLKPATYRLVMNLA